ncbi:hypothetical protein DRE_07392 [Drechslerella stenobrocha 248]|uniref:Uncharacterized protein n=1 Tax=Drechslerella stenobrocha 248 TaxID=1043628 RepID=W7HUJ4_9PEZI|nr:hypothetical protein DRE_07392 [Drechslerella stenobrocha 248]
MHFTTTVLAALAAVSGFVSAAPAEVSDAPVAAGPPSGEPAPVWQDFPPSTDRKFALEIVGSRWNGQYVSFNVRRSPGDNRDQLATPGRSKTPFSINGGYLASESEVRDGRTEWLSLGPAYANIQSTWVSQVSATRGFYWQGDRLTLSNQGKWLVCPYTVSGRIVYGVGWTWWSNQWGWNGCEKVELKKSSIRG